MSLVVSFFLIGFQTAADVASEIEIAKKIAVKEYFLEKRMKAREKVLPQVFIFSQSANHCEQDHV